MGLGSFFKSMFGGEKAPEPEDIIEHKGFQIILKPRNLGGNYGVGAIIRKEIDGEIREHQFIRADQIPSKEQCNEITLMKVKTAIDQLGDDLFQPQ
ncbi:MULTISPECIES: HlyU family transcriptional regulator [unclassified Hahella]|uniref:HlyU family transcriptional regulator n=1 Tax=unclassified Hahella TaxID=2624107 RepID=UPI001C1EA95C|nr:MULTISPECIES: HlyU family transcriptional regulator [unclassified Hahella]MBU6951250.1 hypothetical protein [Hahella sp. HN01]MDG9670518.1 HlyU family transcriptional regulator [Hahella sp. CR1]